LVEVVSQLKAEIIFFFFFKSVTNNKKKKKEWDGETIISARGCHDIIQIWTSIFFESVFKVLPQTKKLFEIMQTIGNDISGRIPEFLNREEQQF
jgi:hypothetical protein